VLFVKGKMEQIHTNVKEEIRAQSNEERISTANELSMLVKLREQQVLSDLEFQRYGSMSLIEFKGYFEGKFESIEYTRIVLHTTCMNEKDIIEYANVKQKSLVLEFNNKLIFVSEAKTTP